MILAGDIGGTKTDLAIFRNRAKELIIVRQKIFPSRNYRSLDEVIEEFLQGERDPVHAACFGVAGPVVQGRCEATNLPWIVDSGQLANRFQISNVLLLNDLETTAYGLLDLEERDLCMLNPGRPQLPGHKCIIAAGTGLGEAALFWNGSEHRPYGSEGGHADFAPRNALEMSLLDYLLKRFSRVSYERVLSGPGLMNIYQFLKETHQGEEPLWLAERLAREEPASVISELAFTEKSELCVKALDLFISVYGAEAGNLALRTLATGGVYLGGGIAPKILEKLLNGIFMKAFLDKGRFASYMNRIPVRVILNEQTALLGAARYAAIQEKKPS
ncbi:MAG: glucokinase [Nitrospiria bacterium]